MTDQFVTFRNIIGNEVEYSTRNQSGQQGTEWYYQKKLKYVHAKEFAALPRELQVKYILIFFSDIDRDLINNTLEENTPEAVFAFSAKHWAQLNF